MKISELIERLEELKKEHGDDYVYKEYDGITVGIQRIEKERLPTSWEYDADYITRIVIV